MAIHISTQKNSDYDAKIQSGLRKECEKLTGITEDFPKHSIYIGSEGHFYGGILLETYGKILWIDSIWVATETQNQGIGKRLIQEALSYAKKIGVFQIQLNTYFPKAHVFFLSQGFETVTSLPHWKYGLTCYLMRRVL